MAQFTDFYQGISRSRSDQQGFTNLVNCDVHTEIGFLSPQKALENDVSSNVPQEACIMCKTPTGTIYAFSMTTANFWKYNGTWSYKGSNQVEAAIRGAKYYNGSIYFAGVTKLGRFTAETEASITLVGNMTASAYRPMEEVNLTLFIGNGKDVASVNTNGTYNGAALDTPPNFTVTTLSGVGVDLLIGTVIGNNVNNCSVFLWDTYSDSWSVEDKVPERGINCFINSDDVIYALCGTKGQLYYWSGATMVRFKKIPGITTTVNPYMSTVLAGRCLIAAEGKVFSLHKEDNDMPNVVVQEYTTTTGAINSLETYVDNLIVSTGTKINKSGTSYATAVIDTPEIAGYATKVVVNYDKIPTGTSIGISVRVNNISWVPVVVKEDKIKQIIYFDGGLKDVNFIQARVTLTSLSNTYPKIRMIEIK